MFAEPRGEMATPTETDVIYHYFDDFSIKQHLLDFVFSQLPQFVIVSG